MLDLMKKRRWGLLLALLTFSFLFDSATPATLAAEALSRALYVAVFAGAVLAANLPRPTALLALTIVATWPMASLLNYAVGSGATASLDFAYSATILVGAQVITFRELARDSDSRADVMFGSMFGYLLIALSFALLYVQLYALQPGSFDLADSDPSVLIYLSVVTITTLGYGDYTPVSPLARTIAGLEAAIGVMYIAVFVGRIVSSGRD